MASQIWVKSYPYTKEIFALTDLGKKNISMEVFFSADMKLNEECAKICKNEFPNWGVELFVYQGEEKRQIRIIYDMFSSDKNIAKISLDYFNSALELAEKYGAQHLQLDAGNYKGRLGEDINKRKEEFIKQRLSFLKSLKNKGIKTEIFYENGIPMDDHKIDEITGSPLFTCIGHNLSDFGEKSLPLEYDVAHHAITLDLYTRAKEFGLQLTKQEKGLVKKIKEMGITKTLIEEIKNKKIYFTHLGNAQPFKLLTKTDVSEGVSSYDLLDLKQILPILMNISENITPEVGEQTGDFEKRPYLRKWVNALQTGNYDEVL